MKHLIPLTPPPVISKQDVQQIVKLVQCMIRIVGVEEPNTAQNSYQEQITKIKMVHGSG